MKKLRNCFLIVFYMQYITANTLDVTNITSSQISINLQTDTQTIPTQIIPQNLNPILNDINEPDPNPTTISFDSSPVRKIVIIRFAPNMPQVIYYDNQNTADANQAAGGMKSLSLSVRQNKMIVWNDYVEINNVGYSLNDLNSYVVRVKNLKDNLSSTNIDATQKQIDDVASSLDQVRQSDMAPNLASQIAVIQALIDSVSDAIKIMQASALQVATPTAQDATSATQDTSNNNASGPSNDLDGYMTKINQLKDDLSLLNFDATQKQIDDMKNSINLVRQSNMTPQVAEQVARIQAVIDNVSNDIKIIKSMNVQIKELQDLQNNLSLGDNNLTGTNKPYKPADDSIDRAQKMVNALKKGMPTILESNLDRIVSDQVQILQNSMSSLQNSLDQIQTSRAAINYEELVPPVSNLQTFQNI